MTEFERERFDEMAGLEMAEAEREYEDSIEYVLDNRERTYGSFTMSSIVSQGLKAHLQMGENWEALSANKKEALEMICYKMARVVNGDSNYKDSWTDIAGYATLVRKEL